MHIIFTLFFGLFQEFLAFYLSLKCLSIGDPGFIVCFPLVTPWFITTTPRERGRVDLHFQWAPLFPILQSLLKCSNILGVAIPFLQFFVFRKTDIIYCCLLSALSIGVPSDWPPVRIYRRLEVGNNAINGEISFNFRLVYSQSKKRESAWNEERFFNFLPQRASVKVRLIYRK